MPEVEPVLAITMVAAWVFLYVANRRAPAATVPQRPTHRRNALAEAIASTLVAGVSTGDWREPIVWRWIEMSSDPKIADRRAKLSPIQYAVTQEASTEPPFSGIYWDHHGDGTYRCVVCGEPLFDSGTKFESGTGWPSFYDVVEKGHVATKEDRSQGMSRTEVTCAHCGAHLGHLFPDGPDPTGMRYCINSAALTFAPRDEPGD